MLHKKSCGYFVRFFSLTVFTIKLKQKFCITSVNRWNRIRGFLKQFSGTLCVPVHACICADLYDLYYGKIQCRDYFSAVLV